MFSGRELNGKSQQNRLALIDILNERIDEIPDIRHRMC